MGVIDPEPPVVSVRFRATNHQSFPINEHWPLRVTCSMAFNIEQQSLEGARSMLFMGISQDPG
jgi:hypothetical protein